VGAAGSDAGLANHQSVIIEGESRAVIGAQVAQARHDAVGNNEGGGAAAGQVGIANDDSIVVDGGGGARSATQCAKVLERSTIIYQEGVRRVIGQVRRPNYLAREID